MTWRTENLRSLRVAGGLAAAVLLAGPAWADDKPDYSANLFGDLGGFHETFAKNSALFNPGVYTRKRSNEAVFEATDRFQVAACAST